MLKFSLVIITLILLTAALRQWLDEIAPLP